MRGKLFFILFWMTIAIHGPLMAQTTRMGKTPDDGFMTRWFTANNIGPFVQGINLYPGTNRWVASLLGSGTADSSHYLRGDGVWATVAGSGTVTSVGLTMPAEFSVSGSPVTASGTLAVTRVAQNASLVLAGPTSGGAAVPTFRLLVASDLGTGTTDSSHYLRGDGTWATISGTGTVTSVGLSAPGEFSVSGSPVTGSGTLTFSKSTQTSNTVWAGPTSGAAAAPTFRALVPSDLGTGTADSSHYLRGDGTWATVAGGSVGPNIIANTIGLTNSATAKYLQVTNGVINGTNGAAMASYFGMNNVFLNGDSTSAWADVSPTSTDNVLFWAGTDDAPPNSIGMSIIYDIANDNVRLSATQLGTTPKTMALNDGAVVIIGDRIGTGDGSMLQVVGDIHATGKMTADGGEDPDYLQYNAMTRAQAKAEALVTVHDAVTNITYWGMRGTNAYKLSNIVYTTYVDTNTIARFPTNYVNVFRTNAVDSVVTTTNTMPTAITGSTFYFNRALHTHEYYVISEDAFYRVANDALITNNLPTTNAVSLLMAAYLKQRQH